MIRLLFLFLLLFPSVAAAQTETKAAFIRNNQLWLLEESRETQLTKYTGIVHAPQWSHDGMLLSYQKENPAGKNEIWIYDLKTKRHKRAFDNGFNVQWAPRDNRLAFQDMGVLNIFEHGAFRNAALGVGSYTWLPDGSGFLLSANASLQPDGWTTPILYKKKLSDTADLSSGVTPFFTIPKKQDVLAVTAEDFRLSPSGRWYSFILAPTASLAMDENQLCTLSADGTEFERVAIVASGVGRPQWAYSHDILAYIAGNGRIVFGFKNKQLGVKAMPASLTPNNYAELDFTWTSDASIVTSRVREAEWDNDAGKHPRPVLYSVDIKSGRQTRLTEPPPGFGDYNPQYVRSLQKLIWYRSSSLFDNRQVWTANRDGSGAREWLQNVDSLVFFEPQTLQN
ncbi:TolB family protein [Ectobacillus ponti]|uniref:TolB domain-containing protein n=1 Tax=Ectobacillus ponti TaxID=2961894 RepID=A0AA41X836_9BACI|nr:hypothetical protein [Ectobacillus ponti]MCP8968615.1 hypothetical protein [Ectobacillus ponti]